LPGDAAKRDEECIQPGEGRHGSDARGNRDDCKCQVRNRVNLRNEARKACIHQFTDRTIVAQCDRIDDAPLARGG
jgi:hypothetical protein